MGLDIAALALNGEGFEPVVKGGNHVTAGRKILNFDLERIAEQYSNYEAIDFYHYYENLYIKGLLYQGLCGSPYFYVKKE